MPFSLGLVGAGQFAGQFATLFHHHPGVSAVHVTDVISSRADELVGNAYTSDRPKVPLTLAQAYDAFVSSPIARKTLGDDVVDHYANMAAIELAAFDSTVTDWERRRGFERL